MLKGADEAWRLVYHFFNLRWIGVPFQLVAKWSIVGGKYYIVGRERGVLLQIVAIAQDNRSPVSVIR